MFKWSSIKRLATHRPAGILGLVAGILLLCQGNLLAGAGSASPVEYRVKAAFLYNFTKFIEWPADGEGKAQPFRVGILGEDFFGDEIKGLTDKTVGDRKMTVQRYPAWDDRVKESDILFISGSEEMNLTEIIRRLDGIPVLTVGDTAAYAKRGVMINFFMEDNKVRFKINLKQAQRAGFKISSRLLKLAVILDDPAQ
jgi:hypothetical protein